MARHKRHEDHEEHASEAWLVAFADMMTLLMVTFLMMFAISALDLQKFKVFQEAFEAGLGKSLPAQAATAQEPGPPTAETEPAPTAADPASSPVVQSKDVEALQEELEAAVDAAGLSQQVTVALDDRGVVIYVTSGVLFDSGAATLLPEGDRLLDGLAPVFASVSNELDIEGHTDDRPIASSAFPSNWELSTSRSTSVLRSLIARPGIDAARVSASGFADTRPRVPNDSPEHQAANRRVEVVVVVPTPPAAPAAAPAAAVPAAAPAAEQAGKPAGKPAGGH